MSGSRGTPLYIKAGVILFPIDNSERMKYNEYCNDQNNTNMCVIHTFKSILIVLKQAIVIENISEVG